MSSSVADLVVEALGRAGVRRSRGVPGDSLNAITDHVRTRREIQRAHLQHDETATIATGVSVGGNPMQWSLNVYTVGLGRLSRLRVRRSQCPAGSRGRRHKFWEGELRHLPIQPAPGPRSTRTLK